jgi:hypothetical protein
MTQVKKVRPSDLPNKIVRAPDGQIVRMKVVQADSENLGADLLAAFRSNVRRIRTERARRMRDAADTAQA